MGEVAVYDRQSGLRSVITRQNTSLLEAAQPASWERFDVDRGGTIVEAWLLKPPGLDPDKKYPVVLDVHGGPHGFYGYGFNAVQQTLASHGFLVVFSNPRGSGSYGREFAEQVRCDWGGEDYLDLMAVLDAALERPYADAKRTGIWGYSYGGYMTAWAIGHTQRFKAAVCGAPCFDLESMYGTSDISHAWGPYQWGGKPHEASEAFAAHSPSTFAHRATTPTLIMQGEADDRCPIGQGEQMFVALKQAGLRGRVCALPRRRARHVARRPTLAPSRLPPARPGLVHRSPRRATALTVRSVSALETFIETSLDAALAGAEDEAAARDAAMALFQSVARDVPAYQAFLRQHSIEPAAIRTFADFRTPAAGYQTELPVPALAGGPVPRRKAGGVRHGGRLVGIHRPAHVLATLRFRRAPDCPPLRAGLLRQFSHRRTHHAGRRVFRAGHVGRRHVHDELLPPSRRARLSADGRYAWQQRRGDPARRASGLDSTSSRSCCWGTRRSSRT